MAINVIIIKYGVSQTYGHFPLPVKSLMNKDTYTSETQHTFLRNERIICDHICPLHKKGTFWGQLKIVFM